MAVLYLKGKNQRSPDLSIRDMARIRELFIRKKWPIQDSFDDNVFDKFCKMIAELDKEQGELIIELTENFLWIQESEYSRLFSSVFNAFIQSYEFPRGKKIYLCPLLPEEDFGKTKSSVFLLYMVKAHLNAIRSKYPEFSIEYTDSPSKVNLESVKTDCTLCLIDDFIGTGETVERATQYFLDRQITKDEMVILSLVGMNFGIESLKSKGYQMYTGVGRDKGITSNGSEEQAEIMRRIEKKIGVSDDFQFGYGASEALVKMMRTPNNTFPIYWFQNKGKNKYAPFPR